MADPLVYYAPLAGCSDFAFRKIAAKYRPDHMFCEMVKMEALVRNDPGTLEMLRYTADMRPIGGQLCGAKPELAAQAARIIEDLGFDSIDLNCGCPVDKVTKDGSGSGLLKNPAKIGEILANIVAAVKIPVTVKVRTGWDENSIVAPEVTLIAEQAGARHICVHGRTRQQAYLGPANWSHIRDCKQVATKIKVVGNGDLFSPEAVADCLTQTGCDAVLIARGTMGQPWIAAQIREFLTTGQYQKRTILEHCQELVSHFEVIKNQDREHKIITDIRRISGWYVKRLPGASEYRNALCHATSISSIEGTLRELLEACGKLVE